MSAASDPSPAPRPRLDRVAEALRAMLAAIAERCFRHPVLATALMVVAAVAGTLGAGRLRLDPDITQLLPPSYQSVRDIEALRARFGGVGYVVLLVEGGTPEHRRAWADALAPRLEALPTVQFVDHRVPVEFFEERALYFLDQPDLETLRDRIKARQTWEIERSYLTLDDDEKPPEVDVADLEQKYRQRFEGTAPGGRHSAYHEDADGRALAVFVRPTELASDLSFARRVVGDVEGVVAAARAEGLGPDLHVELTGRYKKRVDLQGLLSHDLTLTSVLALVLMLGYVVFHFRRVTAVVLVVAPLYAGLAMAYGFAALLFGTLNILTAFIGAILAGIGVDNGIHMLGRYEEERRAGVEPLEAIRRAFGEAGRVSLAATVTIGSAFACLTWTDFRAFREFGVLAASGVLFVLFAYVLLLPALLGLLARYAPRLADAPPGLSLPGVGRMHRFAPAIFWLLLAGSFGALTQVPRAHFDADFSRLDDADLPSFRRDKEVNALLGRSQTPMVVLADSPEQSREVAAVVRARMKELGGEATIGLTATRADLLPDDQQAKEPVLREIGKMLSHLHPDKLDEPALHRLEKLRTMAAAAPFGAADLPASLRRVFEPKPGTGPVDFVLLYPTVSTGDAVAVRRLAGQLRDLRLPSGAVVSAAGEPMILADVLATVERDAPRIVLLTALLVLIALRATLGKMRLALLSISPALLTLGVTVGLCPVLGIEINYLNMIILPILLGVGVDDGAHLVARIDAGESLLDVWRHTGWDVTGAILTDIFGFGVLALAAHPGLASLGKLALVGLTVNWLVAIVFLPAALAFLPLVGKAPRQESPSGWLATAGGAGWSPVAPGTIGAVVALPLAWLIRDAGPALRIGAALLVSVVAIWVTARYLRERGSPKDPQEVVIDETAGCFVALCFVPFEPLWILGAFVLFRAFDILKPGPVRWAERRLPGSYGVVVDDLVAGAMAGALLFFAGRFLT